MCLALVLPEEEERAAFFAQEAGGVLMLTLCMGKIYSLIRESNSLRASKETNEKAVPALGATGGASTYRRLSQSYAQNSRLIARAQELHMVAPGLSFPP